VWHKEGSEQLKGPGKIDYNIQLQDPYNCYWLLTGLKRPGIHEEVLTQPTQDVGVFQNAGAM
jgi:hypothetical protein